MKTWEAAGLATCLLLAGCGGSGEGVTSTPPPPPPPPTTPFPLAANASFQPAISIMTYNDPANGGATFDTLRLEDPGPGTTFGYDAASGTYTVQGNGASASFTKGQQVDDTSYSVTYSKSAGATVDAIKLYGNVQSNTPGTPPVVLSYVSYGLWTHSDTSTAKTSKTYFIYGQSTGSANMPVTGTATYQMTAAANVFGADVNGIGGESRVVGTATLTANFGTGAIDTVLKIGPTYTGAGTITGDKFSGTFATPGAPNIGGKFSGGFFGPAAKEAGFTFQILRHDDPYAGASVQPATTYIAGAAVGPKM